MTWGEFKKIVEKNGVEDTDELEWIDANNNGVEVERRQRKDEHWYVSIYSF